MLANQNAGEKIPNYQFIYSSFYPNQILICGII